MLRTLLVVATIAAATPVLADNATDCRLLASAPGEPLGLGVGVPIEEIDSSRAVRACRYAQKSQTVPHNAAMGVAFRHARAMMAEGPRQQIFGGLVAYTLASGTALKPESIALAGDDVAAWYLAEGRAGWNPATYLPAAEAGEPRAQVALYSLYASDRFKLHHPAAAERWLSAAVAQNYPAALYIRALQLLDSNKDSTDQQQGVELMFRAATQGLASAQYEMAFVFRRGEAVPEDRREADRWLGVAAANGDEDALLQIKRDTGGDPSPGELLAMLSAVGILIGAMATMDQPPEVETSGSAIDPSLTCGLAMKWDGITGQCQPDWEFGKPWTDPF